ncbi:MAG: hypothetical protein IPM25_18505 [Chloracidobacterium sp.]|nr:hypothetical protein [Chloracidobacterium sp.]
MKSTGKSPRTGSIIVSAVFFCFILVTAAMSGQGMRAERTPALDPASAPTPTPSEAQVVSRASDFPDLEQKPPQKSEDRDPAAAENARIIAELRSRIEGLEGVKKNDQDEKQKRLLMNLDILNRAEQRSESLRKQLFDMMEKENTVKTKLDLIETNMRPEAIEREVAFAGSLRPEALRDLKKKQLEVEKTNLQAFLTEIQKSKVTLDQNLQRSESLVERLRVKLEKEIEAALTDDPDK